MLRFTNVNSLVLLCLLSSLHLHGQSRPGSVSLSNYDAAKPGGVFDSNQPIFFWPSGGNRVLAPVNGTFVQFLGGPTPNQLVVLSNPGFSTPVGGRDTFGLAEPGFVDAGFAVVPGVGENQEGFFQIRAWRGDTSWEAASKNPSAFIGSSDIFPDLVGAGFPTPFPYPLRHAPSFTIMAVPEPATGSLIILGLVALWLCHRRSLTAA